MSQCGVLNSETGSVKLLAIAMTHVMCLAYAKLVQWLSHYGSTGSNYSETPLHQTPFGPVLKFSLEGVQISEISILQMYLTENVYIYMYI